MKNALYIFLVTSFFMVLGTILKASDKVNHQPSVEVTVKAQQHAKVSLLIGVVGNDVKELHDIAKHLKKDLSFSGQFNVVIQSVACITSTKNIKRFATHYPLAVFISSAEQGQAIEWRLYDTDQATMLHGKKYHKQGDLLRGWAHNMADAVWPVLTGQQGLFSTKIAYCKEVKHKNNPKKLKHIYIADYDGSHEELLVATPTINVAPRWNKDVQNPLLFYSTCTNANIRLMTTNMHKQQRMASNFDGLNMLPSFSKDGKKVVYCASRGDGYCQLYYYEKGIFKRLTHNNGNNVSPTLTDDGTKVYFCSDFQTGRPQIYYYDIANDHLERITDGGYCDSPSYSEQSNKLCYSKIINGTMQLFLYDVTTHKHKQLTFSAGHKQECSWSPCGNYILFAVEQKGISKIAMLNLLTNEQQSITLFGITWRITIATISNPF